MHDRSFPMNSIHHSPPQFFKSDTFSISPMHLRHVGDQSLIGTPGTPPVSRVAGAAILRVSFRVSSRGTPAIRTSRSFIWTPTVRPKPPKVKSSPLRPGWKRKRCDYRLPSKLMARMARTTLTYRDQGQSLTYWIFAGIVCFGVSSDGSPFCLDCREDASLPSIIWWDDCYWRRVAPTMPTFLKLLDMNS